MESLQVFFGAGGMIQRVPKVYDRDGEASFQTKDPFIHNADYQVRVLISPALIAFIESIDVEKILPPDSQIAGFHPMPFSGS